MAEEPKSEEDRKSIKESFETFVEEAGTQLGWAGMTDALVVKKKEEELAKEMRGE